MATTFLPERALYRGHFLNLCADSQGDGRYRARASITFLGAEKTIFQRFLDLETFRTEEEALIRAEAASKLWIDREWAERSLKPGVALPLQRAYG